MKCLMPDCTGVVVHYTEKVYSIASQINKDKTISKRKKVVTDQSYGMPEYLECDTCNTQYSYELNEKGVIIDYYDAKST